MADHVDGVLDQWHAERPDLDVSSMAVVGRLSRLPALINGELGRTFARHGLDPASFDVLATLRRGAARPMTPADLMRASMVTSGAVTQRLDRLERRGLVDRSSCPGDARVVHVTLSGEGRALVDRALPDHVATMDRILSGLTPEQREVATDVLRALLESLGDTGEGIRAHACRPPICLNMRPLPVRDLPSVGSHGATGSQPVDPDTGPSTLHRRGGGSR